MKRKLIKYGILSIVVVLIGWNLSQCTGGNPGNMRQYEIINKIKEKMKAEMDRIDFEVNFDDYEFKVKPLQSFGDYGSVTIKDKRYNYDPIKIYDGSLQQLQQEKIGVNPIIFVAHGYQDYVIKNIFNNVELGNNVTKCLEEVNGELPLVEASDLSSQDILSLDYPVRERTEKEWRNSSFKGAILFFESYKKQEKTEYLSHFKKQNTKDFNYAEFYRKINFLTVVDILIKDAEKINEMEMKIQKMYNSSYLLIRITNKR